MSAVVVIGAGLAAALTVETLRDEGFTGSITLVGDEGVPPYERPALSKGYLQGRDPADSLTVHTPAWYAEMGVDTRFGDAAVSVEPGPRLVHLASGDTLQFAHLVLATGARPRHLDVPGVHAHGVHHLRTLGDSTALRSAFQPGAAVVIVGGGWIGLEVAAAARQACCHVVVLERGPLPLQPVLGDELAGYVADLHRRQGVELRTRANVVGIASRDGHVTGVETTSGTVTADVVLIAAGAVPNTELAETAGLTIDGGVVVDEHLRSDVPTILAAGDVAHARHARLGTRLRVEHWDNAIRQGRLAARSILGRPDTYDWQPYFFTDQFDFGMEFVGHIDPRHQAYEVVIRGEPAGGEFIAFWLADGIVRAAMNVNTWDVNDDLRALIGAAIAPARLRDTTIAITALAQATPALT